MVRLALMVGMVALSCLGIAQAAEARDFSGRSAFAFDQRFESPRFERREAFFDHHRFFDRDRDDRFFFRHRHARGLFFDGFFGFPSGFAFGDPPVTAAPPAAVVADPATPSRSTEVADLPPCHETTESGVAILRGTGCARNRP